MKILPLLFLCLIIFTRTAPSQSLLEQIKANSDPVAMLARWMDSMRGQNLRQLMTNATNPGATPDVRIGSAVLLLKEHESVEGHKAALSAFGEKIQTMVHGWERENAWTVRFPVAFEASNRPELLPMIVEMAVAGQVSEDTVVYVFDSFNKQGVSPLDKLMELQKEVLNTEQRRRCERFISIMNEVWVPRPKKTDTVEATQSHETSSQSSALPTKTELVPTKNETIAGRSSPTKSMSGTQMAEVPMPVWAVMILASSGLVWLMVKNRR